jgi:hypothetical protein
METGTKLGIAFVVIVAAGAGAYFYMKSKQDEDEGDEDEDEGDSETSLSQVIVNGNAAIKPTLTPEQVLALKKAKLRTVKPPLTPEQVLALKKTKMRGGLDTGKKLDMPLGATEGFYDGWRGYTNPSVKTSNKLYWDAWEKGQLDKAKGKPEPPKGSYGVTTGFDGHNSYASFDVYGTRFYDTFSQKW